MDLLVLADSDGVVDMTQEAIAARTRIPLEQVNVFLAKLQEPDARSRTPDSDGRRISPLDEHRDWGWLIVNYDRFRDIATEEQRRVNTKLRVRKHREKIRGLNTSEECNRSVTPCNASVTPPYPSVVKSERGSGEGDLVAKVATLIEQLGFTCYGRPEGERPTYSEEQAALEIVKRPNWKAEKDQMLAFGRVITRNDRKFEFPKKLITMLENWQSSLDLARNYKPHDPPNQKSTATTQDIIAEVNS